MAEGGVVVTGVSTGIGAATLRELVGAGYRVFGTSRRKGADGLEGVTMLACDVTDPSSVTNVVKEVLAATGRGAEDVSVSGSVTIAAPVSLKPVKMSLEASVPSAGRGATGSALPARFR